MISSQILMIIVLFVSARRDLLHCNGRCGRHCRESLRYAQHMFLEACLCLFELYQASTVAERAFSDIGGLKFSSWHLLCDSRKPYVPNNVSLAVTTTEGGSHRTSFVVIKGGFNVLLKEICPVAFCSPLYVIFQFILNTS